MSSDSASLSDSSSSSLSLVEFSMPVLLILNNLFCFFSFFFFFFLLISKSAHVGVPKYFVNFVLSLS